MALPQTPLIKTHPEKTGGFRVQFQAQGNGSRDSNEMREISLTLRLLWERKGIIILFTLLATAAGTGFALFTPPEYTSKTIIAPKSASKSLSSRISINLGGIGSAMASQLGIGNTSLDHISIMLKSQDLARDILSRHDLLPHLFPRQYDFKEDRWKTSDSLKIPTMQDGIAKLTGSVLEVNPDVRREIVVLLIHIHDKALSQKVASWYLDVLNERIQEKVIIEAQENREYLEKMRNQTSDPWLTQKIEGLIQNEIEKSMMVASRSLEILESPTHPEKTNPKPLLALMLSLVASFTFSTFIAALVFYIQAYRESNKHRA